MTTPTDVLPEVEAELSEPDGMSHYARTTAILSGGVLTALCGKKWVPTKIGPEVLDLKICPTCQDLFEMLRSMDSSE